MIATSTLTGSLLRTYNTIFQHPVSHNLEWRHVQALFRHLGQVEEEPNGNLKVTRNGETIVLHPPRTKDVAETEELMALRHFLVRSEKAGPVPENGRPWLLVINHHQARIFRPDGAGVSPQTLLPHEPVGHFHHVHNSLDFSRGQEKTDPNDFFEPVANALKETGPLLVFGTGTGTSSEMDQFTAWVTKHRPDVAGRIIGSVAVDEKHLTDGQLLAKAHDFYTAHLLKVRA